MLWLVASSLLFSLSFGLIKAQVAGLDPFAVAAIRLVLSTLAFVPLMRRYPGRIVAELMAIGAVQFGFMYCAYIASFHALAGHQVALLTTTTPIMVALIDVGLARRWRVAPVAAALVAVAGGLAVVYEQHALRPALLGFGLVQLSNLCFAAGQIWYRRAKTRLALERDAPAFAWIYAGAALAPVVLFFAAGDASALPHTAASWASLLYLGLVPSALGFFLWNKGVTRVDTGTAAIMNNLKIPGAVLIAWLVFGESVVLWRLLASGILLATALLIAREPRSRTVPAPSID